MGRTNPTFRDALRTLREEWAPYRRALRWADQQRFDQLFEYARTHADAAAVLNQYDTIVPVLVSIALAIQRKIDRLESRIEDLEAECDLDEDRSVAEIQTENETLSDYREADEGGGESGDSDDGGGN